ncbi:unnamed protein product [Calypogeia fissa]
MTSSGPQMYPPVQQIPPVVQQQQPQHGQYQPPPPYNPYSSTNANLYANSLISAYGHIPPPPPPIPPQPYAYDQPMVGAKRSSDDVLQSDMLSKRPRPDSGGSGTYFPQRPGERLCAFYMTTRTCSFGLTCKFDHPSWVPFGGIPNWKEVTGGTNIPITADPTNLPQRAGEQNCAFYMKTGECKYGLRCKFNHPKDRLAGVPDLTVQLKEEPVPGVQNNGATAGSDAVVATAAAPASSISAGAISVTHSVPVKVPTPGDKVPVKASPLNSKGLPLRQTETDCTFYIKTGSCKFGATCRFNHPEVIRPVARPVLPPIPAPTLAMNTVSTTPYNNADMYVHDGTVAAHPPPVTVEENGMTTNSVHPQRPGGPDCSYYLKTGECSFGAACKFHHPPNRQPSTPKAAPKLTLAGLPRREGETICAYYMKTGACKYGSTCRFDHPPPGEIAAKAAADATRTEVPPALEAYDVHHPPGVPVQYVDLNPPAPAIMTNGVGSNIKQESITLKQDGTTV